MLIDALISIHSSFQPDMHSELVGQYFLDHNYVNLLEGCISIVPRCVLQGMPIDAFIAGKGDIVRRATSFIVLFIKDTDTLTHTHITTARMVMVYTLVQEIPQLLHKLCIQLYQIERSSKPLRQRVKVPSHLLAFHALPGIGEKKAGLLHHEYKTIRRFIDALRSEINREQLLAILSASHIAKLCSLFNIN